MTTDNIVETGNLEAELASLPEKYRNKSAADLARMHMEAEKALSRQGQELGEYRRLATTLLELEQDEGGPARKKDEPKVEITTDDLINDPNAAIERAVENHPKVRKAAETADKLERQVAQQEFAQAHPDFVQDVHSDGFREWVQASPVRARLFQKADGYDLDAAETLASMWEERKSVLSEAEKAKQEAAEQKRKAAEKAGTLEGSTGADASSEIVLSRAELRELQRRALMGDRQAQAKWNDPKFQQMRKAAYRDQRVK